MRLKIYNPDLVDCSSSVNMLMPSPESMGLIIELFWEIIKSPAVESILSYSFKLEFDTGTYLLISPSGKVHGNFNMYGEKFKLTEKSFPLRTSIHDRENKIFGLFIEPLENAIEGKITEERVRYHGQVNQILVCEAGMRGIKKGIALIQSILGSNNDLIPKAIQGNELLNFELTAQVIWKAWSNYYEISGVGQIQCGEIDAIYAETQRMEFNLGDICLGGHNGRPGGEKHFADIQRAINNIYPKFTIKEFGDSAAEIDGRMALYKESLPEEALFIEPDGILHQKSINQEEKEILLQLFSGLLFSPRSYSIQENHVIALEICHPKITNIFTYLKKLTYLRDLSLIRIPPIEELVLKPLRNLKTLKLIESQEIKTITNSLGDYVSLEDISIIYFRNITSLPKSIGKLQKLKSLKLTGCHQLDSFPIEILELDISTLIIDYCPLLEKVKINNSSKECKNYFKKYLYQEE